MVLSVAFGTVDPLFRVPLPVYQPWWWSFDTFVTTAEKFYAGDRIYFDPLLRRCSTSRPPARSAWRSGTPSRTTPRGTPDAGRGLILVLLISPFWISYLMRIYAWQSLLQPDGYINDLGGLFGLSPIIWIGRPITVVLGLVYGYIPFMILPLFGFLDRIDQHLLEAGRDLGAGAFETFRRVTLPLSKPGIPAGLVIVSLPMFGDYYTNNLLGGTNTSMYGNLIDSAVGQAGQGPEAGSLVLILVVLVMIPMLYYLRSTHRTAGPA